MLLPLQFKANFIYIDLCSCSPPGSCNFCVGPQCKDKWSCPTYLIWPGLSSSMCRNCLARKVEEKCADKIYCEPEFLTEFFSALSLPLSKLDFTFNFLGRPIGHGGQAEGADHIPVKVCDTTSK